MAVDVEELIITPFREVVERGKEAVANAEEAQNDDPEQAKQMMKSAMAITKEGERALKRLQPLWDSQVEKHGDTFKDIIADNGKSFSSDTEPNMTWLMGPRRHCGETASP